MSSHINRDTMESHATAPSQIYNVAQSKQSSLASMTGDIVTSSAHELSSRIAYRSSAIDESDRFSTSSSSAHERSPRTIYMNNDTNKADKFGISSSAHVRSSRTANISSNVNNTFGLALSAHERSSRTAYMSNSVNKPGIPPAQELSSRTLDRSIAIDKSEGLSLDDGIINNEEDGPSTQAEDTSKTDEPSILAEENSESGKPSQQEIFVWYLIGCTAASLISILFATFFIYSASTLEPTDDGRRDGWLMYNSINIIMTGLFVIYMVWGFVSFMVRFIWILALLVNIWSIVYVVMYWDEPQLSDDNVIYLDDTLPMPGEQSVKVVALIGVVSSIYHCLAVGYFMKVRTDSLEREENQFEYRQHFQSLAVGCFQKTMRHYERIRGTMGGATKGEF